MLLSLPSLLKNDIIQCVCSDIKFDFQKGMIGNEKGKNVTSGKKSDAMRLQTRPMELQTAFDKTVRSFTLENKTLR